MAAETRISKSPILKLVTFGYKTIPRTKVKRKMSGKADVSVNCRHVPFTNKTIPKNKAEKSVLHASETSGDKLLKDKIVTTGNSPHRIASKKIIPSPCRSCVNFMILTL